MPQDLKQETKQVETLIEELRWFDFWCVPDKEFLVPRLNELDKLVHQCFKDLDQLWKTNIDESRWLYWTDATDQLQELRHIHELRTTLKRLQLMINVLLDSCVQVHQAGEMFLGDPA